MELYLQPHATSNSEVPSNIPHSKPNLAKLSSEVQLSKMRCPTLKEFLHNPAAINQHLTLATLTSLMLKTANNSIPLKNTLHTKTGGMRNFVKHNMLPSRLTNCRELQANSGIQITYAQPLPIPKRKMLVSSTQTQKEERESFFASLDFHNTDS